MKLFEFKTYKDRAESKTTISISTVTLFIIALILGIWMAVQLWPWEGICLK